jgi:6-pyruvoyltetrahydropterin/6-carboxytetrahydropterin synthase
MRVTAERYHDISCGHRVVGHENKCRHLHGHNYRIRFVCAAEQLDVIGRVIDFGVIKERLCMWVEQHWDHKFLAWERDTLVRAMLLSHAAFEREVDESICSESVVYLPFNPTAEHMAQYLVEEVGPEQLEGTGVQLVSCTVEETRKCSASFTLSE